MSYRLLGTLFFKRNKKSKGQTINTMLIIDTTMWQKIDPFHFTKPRLKEYEKLIKKIGMNESQWKDYLSENDLDSTDAYFTFTDNTGTYRTDEDIIAIHNKECDAKRKTSTAWPDPNDFIVDFHLMGWISVNRDTVFKGETSKRRLQITVDSGYDMNTSDLRTIELSGYENIIKRIGMTGKVWDDYLDENPRDGHCAFFKFEDNTGEYHTDEDVIAIYKKEEAEREAQRAKKRAVTK